MSTSSGSDAAGTSGRTPLASTPHQMMTSSTGAAKSGSRPAAGGAQKPAPKKPAPKKPAPQKPAPAKPRAATPARTSTKGLVRPAPRPRVRRARLVATKVDTWSVLKLAFLLSVALGIVTVVASVVLWIVLDITGLFDGVNEMLGMLGGAGGALDIKDFLSLGQVAIFATIVSVVNVILLTALSVLAALLYNIAAALVGGVGVTLTDD